MNCKERFINTMMFEEIDRIPLVEWNIREATMAEWIRQGYPEGVRPYSFFNLDPIHFNVAINMGMYPYFEEEILSETEEHKVWRDGLGAIRKDFKKDDTPGFVTRSWLEFPVKNKEDFEAMKKRYDANAQERYPEHWSFYSEVIKDAVIPSHLSIPYLFWTARDWMGFEGLCMAFYDMPELLHEMFTFITDFCIEVLQKAFESTQIDIVELKEDMAYKHAPMISPDLFKEFMLPHYKRLVAFLKTNGVKFVYVDCDGYPGKLIPLWIEAGVDGMSPCEVAAGNDLIKLREAYPNFALLGGIDKRELAKGREEIYNEVMSKVPKMLESGGYIPHVDHAIPPDVPLKNYMYYRKILTAVVHGNEVEKP